MVPHPLPKIAPARSLCVQGRKAKLPWFEMARRNYYDGTPVMPSSIWEAGEVTAIRMVYKRRLHHRDLLPFILLLFSSHPLPWSSSTYLFEINLPFASKLSHQQTPRRVYCHATTAISPPLWPSPCRRPRLGYSTSSTAIYHSCSTQFPSWSVSEIAVAYQIAHCAVGFRRASHQRRLRSPRGHRDEKVRYLL